MGSHRLNASFLTPDQLADLGVEDAARRNILIHSTAVIVDMDAITFGSNVRIDPYCVITAKSLSIGDYVHISPGCGIFGEAQIVISDFCAVSWHSIIFSSSDDLSGVWMTNPMVPEQYSNVQSAPVSIGRHVVLGARTTVLPGSVVGDGATTGAASLVRGALEPWSLSVGTPARFVRERARDCLTLEKQLRADIDGAKAP